VAVLQLPNWSPQVSLFILSDLLTKSHAVAPGAVAVWLQRGREGVEEEWEQTDEFHERWKTAARDVLAKAAFRHKKLTKRVSCEGLVAGRGVATDRSLPAWCSLTATLS
jgi:hypothetical protein